MLATRARARGGGGDCGCSGCAPPRLVSPRLLPSRTRTLHPAPPRRYVENTDGYYTHDFKIAYNTGVGPSTQTFLRQLNATITQKMGLDVRKQYVDQFANGISVYSMFVRGSEQEILDMKRYCSLAFAIPDKDLFNQYIAGKISGRELIYFHSACRFACVSRRVLARLPRAAAPTPPRAAASRCSPALSLSLSFTRASLTSPLRSPL